MPPTFLPYWWWKWENLSCRVDRLWIGGFFKHAPLHLSSIWKFEFSKWAHCGKTWDSPQPKYSIFRNCHLYHYLFLKLYQISKWFVQRKKSQKFLFQRLKDASSAKLIVFWRKCFFTPPFSLLQSKYLTPYMIMFETKSSIPRH